MSPTGKWIVECKYDRIGTARPFWQLLSEHEVYRENSTFDKDFFLFGFLGERKMLLNSRGETLYDLSIHDRLEFDGNVYMRIIKPNTRTTVYLDTAGNILFDDFPRGILLFGKRDFSLQGDEIRHHSDIMIGNVRLINRLGDTLLDEQFDQARLVGEDRIHFIRGLEVSEVSFEKDQIKQTTYTPFLKLKNKIIYFDSISYMLAELSANGSEIVSLNSLNINSDFYGNMYIAENSRSKPLLVYNWRTKKILPLKNLRGIARESKDRYTIFTRNSHYGVVDKNGKLIVDTLYSAI